MNHVRRLYRLPLSLFTILCAFGIFPARVHAGVLYTTDGVNIRKKADASSKVCGTVTAGTSVTKTGKEGNWIAVNADGIQGYIYKDYLSKKQTAGSGSSSDTSKNEEPQITSKTCYVSSGVNLRKKANSSSAIQTVLPEGEKVSVLSKSGNWSKVSTSDGQKGYIYSQYLNSSKPSGSDKTDSEADSRQDSQSDTKSDIISDYRFAAISYVKNHRGDTYSQAKRDMDGYADCSSLVQKAYETASGKSIGGTTVTQTENMSAKLYSISSIYDVTPGDIVYHLSGDNHAGLYIGNGKVIHASQTAGKVKTSTFDEDSTYWEYGCNAAAYCYEQ